MTTFYPYQYSFDIKISIERSAVYDFVTTRLIRDPLATTPIYQLFDEYSETNYIRGKPHGVPLTKSEFKAYLKEFVGQISEGISPKVVGWRLA